MKLSSIRVRVIASIWTVGCTLVVSAQSPYSPTSSTKAANHPTTAEKNDVIRQKFNPIFGAEKESNALLSFISANMVLELDAASVKNIDGYVALSFQLDTLGNIDRLTITKSLRPWIDYAIIDGMKKLPSYGKPSTRNNGKIYVSNHNMVFSFGTFVRSSRTYGFQGEAVTAATQAEIDRQRNEHFARINEQNSQWEKFTSVNSRLVYDTKNGLKNQAGSLAPDSQIGTPDNLPTTTPTISITNKEL